MLHKQIRLCAEYTPNFACVFMYASLHAHPCAFARVCAWCACVCARVCERVCACMCVCVYMRLCVSVYTNFHVSMSVSASVSTFASISMFVLRLCLCLCAYTSACFSAEISPVSLCEGCGPALAPDMSLPPSPSPSPVLLLYLSPLQVLAPFVAAPLRVSIRVERRGEGREAQA